jgi:hypothetical protein
VVQDVFIFDVPKIFDPAENARARCGCLALVANAVNVGTRRIHPPELATKDQEQDDEDDGDQEGWNEGRDERGQRVRRVPVGARIRSVL